MHQSHAYLWHAQAEMLERANRYATHTHTPCTDGFCPW